MILHLLNNFRTWFRSNGIRPSQIMTFVQKWTRVTISMDLVPLDPKMTYNFIIHIISIFFFFYNVEF